MVYEGYGQARPSAAGTALHQGAQRKGPAPLEAGTWIGGGQYLIEAMHERRRWTSQMQETIWMGQDAHVNKIVIMDIVIPGDFGVRLDFVHAVTRTLLQAKHSSPYAPELLNCFSEPGHLFFIVKALSVISLSALMAQAGGRLPQEQVYECSLHLTELLSHLWQHMPPLVHGFICPHTIVWTGMRWTLMHFSLIIASGCFPSLGLTEHSAYQAPELMSGHIRKPHHDLYAILASAYHALTGMPPEEGARTMLGAQLQRAGVSERFAAIVLQGLHPVAAQRFQAPAHLLAALQAVQQKSVESRPGALRDTRPPAIPKAARPESSSEHVAAPSAAVVTQARASRQTLEDTHVSAAAALLPYEARKFGDRLYPLMWVMLLFVLFCLLAALATY